MPMEPEKIPEQQNTSVPKNVEKTAVESMHDEGIDIVGTGVSEENEFSSPEATTPIENTESIQAEPATTLVTPIAPTAIPQNDPVKGVRIPTAAEIIASFRQPKPPVSVQTAAERPSLSTESAKLIASLQEIPTGFQAAPKPRMPVPPPPVRQAAAPSMPIPTVAPTFAPQPTPSNTPVAQPEHSLNDPSIKQIRTFKSDAEEAVKYQNVSAMDIALAEQRKREKTAIQYEEPKQGHHAGLFIVIVILLMLVLGAGWYFWFSSSQIVETKPAVTVTVDGLIPYAKASLVVLDPESDSLVLIGAKLRQANAGLGNVHALIPVASSQAVSQADVESVFKGTSMPSRLARSLDSSYMIGTYTYDTQNPFLILKNTFFQNAFSGMLEWEKDMRRDLLPLSQVAHSTESTATAASSQFEDAIVSNIDARTLKDASGKTVLIYAFADKNTIVVTTGESALKYILERLLTVRTIQ